MPVHTYLYAMHLKKTQKNKNKFPVVLNYNNGAIYLYKKISVDFCFLYFFLFFFLKCFMYPCLSQTERVVLSLGNWLVNSMRTGKVQARSVDFYTGRVVGWSAGLSIF